MRPSVGSDSSFSVISKTNPVTEKAVTSPVSMAVTQQPSYGTYKNSLTYTSPEVTAIVKKPTIQTFPKTNAEGPSMSIQEAPNKNIKSLKRSRAEKHRTNAQKSIEGMSDEDVLINRTNKTPEQIASMSSNNRKNFANQFRIKTGDWKTNIFGKAYLYPRVSTGIVAGTVGAVAGGVSSEDGVSGALIGGLVGGATGAADGKLLRRSLVTKTQLGKDWRNLGKDYFDKTKAISTDVYNKVAAYNIQSVLGGRLPSNFSTTDNKGIRRARSMDKLIGVKNKIDVALENEMKFVQENMATLSNEQKVKAHFNIKHLREVQSRLGKSLSQVHTGAGGNVSEAVHSPLKDNIVRTILDLPKKYQSKNIERTTRIKNIGGESKKVVNSIVAAPSSSKMKLLLPLGLAAGVAGIVGYKYYKNNAD